MSKRQRTPQDTDNASKRLRPAGPKPFNPIKIATPEAAAAADANPPFKQLSKALGNTVKNPAKGDCIVYWMRMHDLRSKSLAHHFFDPHQQKTPKFQTIVHSRAPANRLDVMGFQ